MYKLCGKCGWRSDKCKNPSNVNYNNFRNYFDVCSNKVPDSRMGQVQKEQQAQNREIKHLIRHGDDDL